MAREITFMGRAVVVRQLTAKETAEFFDTIGDIKPNIADILMNRVLPCSVVCTATGLTTEDLTGDVCPSDLLELWEAVEQVNPFFLQALERLSALGQTYAAAAPGIRSAGPPVSLPDPVTVPA